MTTFYVPLYSEWMDRFTKSLVMLYDATKSMSHLLSLVRETKAQFMVISEGYNRRQFFAV